MMTQIPSETTRCVRGSASFPRPFGRSQRHRAWFIALLIPAVLLSGWSVPVRADEEDAGEITPEAVDLGRPVEFRRDIYPILAGSCLACHNRTKAESDLVLETAADVVRGGAAGEAVVPGEPDESYLYMVASRSEEPVMPPVSNSVEAKPLTPRQLGLLRQWILEGAKGDDGGGSGTIAWQNMSDRLQAVYSIDADSSGRFVAAGRAGKVTVYDLKAPAQVRRLVDPELQNSQAAHRDYAHAVQFSPDGRTLATAGYRCVKVWTRSASADGSQRELPRTDVNVSADGSLLVKVTESGTAQLFRTAENQHVADLNVDLHRQRQLADAEAERAMREARVGVVKAQVGEHEKRLEEQTKSLADAVERHRKAKEETLPAKEKALADAQAALAEPKKQLAAAQAALAEAEKQPADNADSEELKKTVAEKKKAADAQKKKVDELQAAVMKAEKAVEDARKAVESAERGIELAEQAKQRAEQRLQERRDLLKQCEEDLARATARRDEVSAAAAVPISVLAAVFLPKDPVVATIEADGTVRLWNTADGAPVDVLHIGQAIEGSLKEAATDGRFLKLTTSSGQQHLMDLFPDWKLVTVLGPADDAENVFVDRVLSLAFSPDGTRLATGGGEASRSGEITIWKTSDWTLERRLEDAHSDTVYGLDFSADGQFLASAAADKFVKVFRVDTGEPVQACEGHTHHVMDVSWKGDRTSLVSAGADNALKIWDAETGEQRRTVTTHKKQVTSVEFVGLQDRFVSTSGDRRVVLHQAADGKVVREFPGSSDYVYCSSVTPDGNLVVAGCEDGMVRVWNGADGKLLATFRP